MRKYVFRKYKEDYPKLYVLEKKRLMKILPKEAKIEHIGSTAVLGLGGKGILDIQIGFKTKDEMKKAEKIMEKRGYQIMPGSKRFGRISLKKYYGLIFWRRRVHIHLVIFNGRIWKRNIKFRNNLRKNKELRAKYEKMKKEAVKYAKGEGKKYRKYKDKFIKKYQNG